MKSLISLAFLMGILHPAGFTYADGNKLLVDCKSAVKIHENESTSNAVGATFCVGYLSGIIGTLSLISEAPNSSVKSCFPPDMTGYQGARIITSYLEEHPEELHNDKFFLAITALYDAFPC